MMRVMRRVMMSLIGLNRRRNLIRRQEAMTLMFALKAATRTCMTTHAR